jgi:hypothetical protein
VNGNVVALAVVVLGSTPDLAGSAALVGVDFGVLEVLDGDTPPLGVDVGSVFVAGVVVTVVVTVVVFVVVVGGGVVWL